MPLLVLPFTGCVSGHVPSTGSTHAGAAAAPDVFAVLDVAPVDEARSGAHSDACRPLGPSRKY